MCACYWRQKDVVRCGLTGLFDFFSGLCILSRWLAGGLFMGMDRAV